MVCRYDKVICIGIEGDAPNQLHYLSNRLLAGHEHFIFCICFVPSGINLIMVHIYGLPARKNIPQLRLFQGLNVIELHTDTAGAVLLQNSLTADQVITKRIVSQNLIIIGDGKRCVGQKRSHSQTGI